tara:strand:- start:1675 stop:1884 length:210 start_codon:yes stop_codon:yes gene_type:complete
MQQSLPILVMLAVLILVLGIVSIMAIVLVAKRCGSSQQCSDVPHESETDQEDPWKEAGNRLKSDFDELE